VTTLHELADFINNNRVTTAYEQPSVGITDQPVPAFLATVQGNKLAWVNPRETSFAVSVATVHEIFKENDNRYVARVDEEWMEQRIVFATIATPNILNTIWRNTLDALSESDEANHQLVKDALERNRNVQTEDGDLRAFDYVRWSGFDPDVGAQVPMGVIAVGPEKRLAVRAFPGYHQDATQFGGRAVPLEKVSTITDQLSMVSAPMKVKAASWEDALNRGLYDYAKDYYEETGRSVYA
jgi:hypothetical protein